jgi:hypothetical protein
LRRVAVTVLVLVLLAGTTVAFVLTEELKLERSPIVRPRFDLVFSPTCACRRETARLMLRLRRANTIDAVIVDDDGEPVRSLETEVRHEPGRLVYAWDGRSDGGSVVPDGRYRLRLHFARERRTILVPNVVRVDTQPPEVELVNVAPRGLSPDGDGRRDSATIELTTSERAAPLLLVDGVLAVRGREQAAGTGELVWPGTSGDGPLGPGRYALGLQARDRAGNVASARQVVAVRIRYIELAGGLLRARRGGLLRIRVLTDARQFRWTLSSRGRRGRTLLDGTARRAAFALRLPPRIRAGRYVLHVAANGYADDATVVVRRRR